MNEYKNKYNGKIYILIEKLNNKVKLQRNDGTVFIISETEFNFYYRKI